jgi:hypothetical protein
VHRRTCRQHCSIPRYIGGAQAAHCWSPACAVHVLCCAVLCMCSNSNGPFHHFPAYSPPLNV